MDTDASRLFTVMGVKAIQMQCDPIEVSSYSAEPDPDWKFTDSHGHYHWMSKKKDNRYPTLLWIVDDEGGGMDDWGGEYPPSGHYECPACGEHIEPGTRAPSNYKTFIRGPIRAWIEFSDNKRIYLSQDEIDKLNQYSSTKYDYGFTKLRAFISELKSRADINIC